MSRPNAAPGRRAALTVAALGVVFGDIGTSPLYAFAQSLIHVQGDGDARADVLGLLSLIVWSLTLVVSLKYLTFVMRADNQGEGGLFALLGLLAGDAQAGRPEDIEPPATDARSPGGVTAVLVMAGAALLYGDGMITPTISVLSAMEGLHVVSPVMGRAVLPLTCAVLLALFALQRRGPGAMGRLFGPVMAVWFFVLAALGAWHVVRSPAVLAALDPAWAIRYFANHGVLGATVLGAIVLAVTGAEALYADMGQFGRGPIRGAWFVLVMPSLLLNYLGQGALVLHDPSARGSPFFAMVPAGLPTIALVVLSTAATVIASQAMIAGAFSMTHQAIQLGFLPRLRVAHTSPDEEGQVYVPAVNAVLAIGCLLLALTFRHSSRLASAYGIAVTGTMAITSAVFFQVTRKCWRWSWPAALALLLLFLAFDVPFVAANLSKVAQGGFVPLAVGLLGFLVMAIWHRGRAIYREQLSASSLSLTDFARTVADMKVMRTAGTAVVLSSDPERVPPVLVQLARRLKSLPATVLMVTVHVLHAPRVERRAQVEALGHGLYRLVLTCGFMEKLNLPRTLAAEVARAGLDWQLDDATYLLERDSFLASSAGRMGRISERLFALLADNANSVSGHFSLPAHQVVEIGEQRDL